MPRALISVSDKRGVANFARDLIDLGWEIISTGGTAHVISQADVAVTPIEDVTGFPEIMDGRVKTLHPAVHAALLAQRDVDTQMDELASHGFEPIDLVAANLYPFRETIGRPNVKFADAIEQIDIGGPTMLRSAAKNHDAVIVLVNPADYETILRALRNGGVDAELRRELASKVFAHTAAYDAVIAQYFAREEEGLPATMSFVMERLQSLRYGENPV